MENPREEYHEIPEDPNGRRTGGCRIGAVALADWQPRKPVEFIIMAGTGGGADQIARLLQGLIEQKGLSSRPFIPINKPGGSGAEALRYMQDKAGDDHTVMMTLNSFYTTPIIQEDLGVDVTKFTPIGLMAMDTFLLWVHTDRDDITDLDSYVAAVKAAGLDWKVGGTGSGQEDSVLTAMMEAGFRLRSDLHSVSGRRNRGQEPDRQADRLDGQQPLRAACLLRGRRLEAAGAVHWRADGRVSGTFQPQGNSELTSSTTCSARSTALRACPPKPLSSTRTSSRRCSTALSGRNFACLTDLTCDGMLNGADLAAFHASQVEAHKKLIAQVGAGAITGE